MLSLLKRYVELLRLVLGPQCGHYELVLLITAELNARQHVFEALTAHQVASLLWQIFMDSQRFLSTSVDICGNLPQTLLRTTYNEVAAGIVLHAHLNAPYAWLLGQDAGEPSEGTDMVGEASPALARGELRIFRHVPAAIKTALRGVKSKYPAITITEIMAAYDSPLSYGHLVRMAPASATCVLELGACKNSRCSYKHGALVAIQATRAETVDPKLAEAYNAYDAAQ
jgi:hypothetical protein